MRFFFLLIVVATITTISFVAFIQSQSIGSYKKNELYQLSLENYPEVNQIIADSYSDGKITNKEYDAIQELYFKRVNEKAERELEKLTDLYDNQATEAVIK